MTVYFAAAGGRIKIGFTEKAVAQRIAQLSANLADPLEIIGHIPGPRRLEKQIHNHLADYRLKGEWFKDCEEVRRSIRNFILASDIIETPPNKKNKSHIPRASGDVPPFHVIFAKLSNLVWPNRPADGAAELLEVPISQIHEWFQGNGKPPKLLRMAFAMHLQCWMFEAKKEAF